jgi:hypothetical protein
MLSGGGGSGVSIYLEDGRGMNVNTGNKKNSFERYRPISFVLENDHGKL